MKNALDSIEGIISSEVNMGNAKVTYDDSKIPDETIIGAVTNAGYKVVN